MRLDTRMWARFAYSLSPVTKVNDFQFYSQMDDVLFLNSGGSVVQLRILDPSLHVPPKNLEQEL